MTRLSILPVVFLAAAAALTGCRGTSDHPGVVHGMGCDERIEAVRHICTDDSVSRWIPTSLEMPDQCSTLHVNHIGNLAEVFNDSNYVHWADAEKAGLSPLTDTRSHWRNRRPMEKVTPCSHFYVEELNYSAPYLVPGAARMLHEIGRRFQDTLQARGGGNYRIKVTSVLRTPENVRRLHRVNSNSIDSSTHTLGTTVDISYARFVCDKATPARRAEDLKGVLAEVLLAMRDEGWCWVKYERKQPCFHISYRGTK